MTTRRGFVTGALCAGFALAAQPVSAAAISTDLSGLDARDVQIPVADRSIPGYRARPAGMRGGPVVLVVQEIFGVHEYIRDVCRRFAKLGYYAIAPELFVRQGDVAGIPSVAEILSKVVSKVPDAQVMGDLDATLAFAKSEEGDVDRAMMTGFCWGGRITWLYAARNPSLRCAAAWYGRLTGSPSELQPTHPIDVAATLRVPVLGLYGGSDEGIPLADIERMRAALASGASGSRIELFADAPHGFHADYRPSYRERAAQDAWAKLTTWFREHL